MWTVSDEPLSIAWPQHSLSDPVDANIKQLLEIAVRVIFLCVFTSSLTKLSAKFATFRATSDIASHDKIV